jgi:hypothetical protein
MAGGVVGGAMVTHPESTNDIERMARDGASFTGFPPIRGLKARRREVVTGS